LPDTKISALIELLSPDNADEIPIVDVSDTSMAPTGTTKRISANNLRSSPGDVVLNSDSDINNTGDIIFQTRGVERGRFRNVGGLRLKREAGQTSEFFLLEDETGTDLWKVFKDGTMLMTVDGSQDLSSGYAHALEVYHKWGGMTLQQTFDHGEVVSDVVDILIQSTGDAIWILHKGGLPVGGNPASAGGMTGVNIGVPLNIDATAALINGTVLNTKTRQNALLIQTYAPGAYESIRVIHSGPAQPALHIITQKPPTGPPANWVVGTGGSIIIEEYSTSNAISVSAFTVPTTSVMSLKESNGGTVVKLLNLTRNDGNIVGWLKSDGSAMFGYIPPAGQFACRVLMGMDGAGVQRTLGLLNRNGAVNDGAQIEFDDGNAQYGLISTTFLNITGGARQARMSFKVASAATLVEQLRLDTTGIGFYNHASAAQQTVTGSRGANAALASLLTALAAYGLIVDTTTV
jgi:hypothetical protein